MDISLARLGCTTGKTFSRRAIISGSSNSPAPKSSLFSRGQKLVRVLVLFEVVVGVEG